MQLSEHTFGRLDDVLAYAESIVDTVREPLIVLNRELQVEAANRSFYKTFQMTPPKLESRFIFDLGGGQWNIPRLRMLLEQILPHDTSFENFPVDHEFPGIGRKSMLLNVRRILRKDQTELILLAIEDITDRTVAEGEMKASEVKYRRLFETAHDGILILNADTGTLIDVNPAFLDLLGYTKAESLTKDLWQIFFKDVSASRIAFDELNQKGSLRYDDLTLQANDGRLCDVEFVGSTYEVNGKKVMQCNIRDITTRKQTEELARQRLESLGILAGGLAHDFNNLLTPIMGNASLGLNLLNKAHSARPLLENVLHASQRAADLTRQLLAYSGKGHFIVTPLDVSDVARKITTLIQSSIPRTVQLKLELQNDLPCVEADASQHEQLIMNLVMNGAEAIGEGKTGTVLVTTGLQNVDEDYIRQTLSHGKLRPGQYVYLEVQDTGCGMDEATRSRIFDPFFTTKVTGRGLGLAAVLGIVGGHKGALRVSTAPGCGSSFKAMFPSLESAEVLKTPVVEQKDLRGVGTILVVDDEELVRCFAKATLEWYGYTVLVAENGQQGVDLFTARADQIILVLLDLTMPVMSGEETMRRLHKIRPKVRVVLSSGYNEAETIRQLTGNGFAGFMQKPYAADQLAEKIKTVLEATQTGSTASGVLKKSASAAKGS